MTEFMASELQSEINNPIYLFPKSYKIDQVAQTKFPCWSLGKF